MPENQALTVDNIPRRLPVLDRDSVAAFPEETITHQWQLLSESIKRQLQSNPDVRRAVIAFAATPVSETLANEVVAASGKNSPQIDRLRYRFQTLGQYLGLPPVPDELITTDIKNAPALGNPIYILEAYGQDYPEIAQEKIKSAIETRQFEHGISQEERELIANRYRLARDCKILSLSAELIEVGPVILSETETVLPSGTKIYIDQKAVDNPSELVNPLNWNKRRVIKDRVFEVEIAGKTYILKEMKTARHTDTKKFGHRQGLTSTDEFKTAAHFQEHGRSNKNGVIVNWEQPLAYVVFPDGYQFSLFGYEQGLVGSSATAHEILYQAIVARKEKFQEEYQRIAKRAKKLRKHPATKFYADPAKKLSFDSFAHVKAYRWIARARDEMERQIRENNYGNSDLDGYAFRIHDNQDNEGKLVVEILGMDFEYFYKIDPAEAKEIIKRYQENHEEDILKGDVYGIGWGGDQRATKTDVAAVLALFEEEIHRQIA